MKLRARLTAMTLFVTVGGLAISLGSSIADVRWSKPISSQIMVQIAANSLSLPTTINVTGAKFEGNISVDLHVDVDLSSMQNGVRALFLLPSDNCANLPTNTWVLSLVDAKAEIADQQFRIEGSGTATQWLCIENPVPNTRVEWETKDVGLGIKTKVPVVVASKGSPIKTILQSVPYKLSAAFGFLLENNDSIKVELSIPSENVPHSELKSSIETSLSDVIAAFRKIVDIRSILPLLPEDGRHLNFVPTSAKFSAESGKPLAMLYYSATVSESQSDALRDALK